MKSLGNLFMLAFFVSIIVGVHAGYKIYMPKYKYEMFKSDAEAMMKTDFRDFRDFNKRIDRMLEEHGVPIPDDKRQKWVITYQDGSRFYAKIHWEVDVDYYGLYQKHYDFDVMVNAS